MNDYKDITTFGLVALLVIFCMAVYAGPAEFPVKEEPEPKQEETTKMLIPDLPDEHPGGFELMMARK